MQHVCNFCQESKLDELQLVNLAPYQCVSICSKTCALLPLQKCSEIICWDKSSLLCVINCSNTFQVKIL